MNDYLIENHKQSGRFIVWRLTEDNRLRQGSHATYEEAYKAMEEIRELMENLE